MRKYIKIIISIFLCLILYGCGESTKVTFNYNCPGVNDYKCSVSDNKLNCMFTMPGCDGKTFAGWYDAKASGNKVNLDKDFTESTTVYAYWKEDMVEEPTKPTEEPTKPTEEPTKPAEEPTTPIEEPAEEPVEIIEIKYKLSFNPNGGNGGQSETIEVKYKESLPQINDIIPTRDGYTFMGWYDNSDYTNGIEYYDSKCNSLRTYDKTSDMTLYAGWKKIEVKPVTPEPVEETKYTVSFNTNGGSGGQSSSVQITYESDMPSINKTVPKKTGYEFMGWYDNSDYTKGNMYYNDKCEAVRNFNRKNDMTLYAGWKIKTYLINFNSNSGSGGQTGSLSVTYNSQLPTINKSKPTRSGYTFTGWYDNSDYTKGTKYYNENCEAVKSYDKTTNLTLYAGWSKVVIVYKYKVTFDINGGNGIIPRVVEATLGSAMPAIEASVPSKSGYTFMGWYDNANYLNGTQYYTNQNKSARSYDRMSDVKLYAGWKKDINKLYIKYNGNGGKWNNPKKDTYSCNSDGYVTLKSTGEVYVQTINYGDKLKNGLVDYNGSYINFIKDNQYVPFEKEYYIKSGSTKNYIDQAVEYNAEQLAQYGGCNLSKNDCDVVVYVNFIKHNYIDIRNKNYKVAYTNLSGWKGYPQNFAISNINKDNEVLYLSASLTGNISASSTSQTEHDNIVTTVISKMSKYTNGKTNYSFGQKMYLKSSGHGQAFDYDTKNKTIITNDFSTETKHGDRLYGGNTGIMGIKFSQNSYGESYSKLFSYNVNKSGANPILDNNSSILGIVNGTNIQLYDYNYNTIKSGKMDFSSPKKTFKIKRSEPTKNSDGTSIPSQGFAINDNYIYELSGSIGKTAYLEVFDFNGQSLYKQALGNGFPTKDYREVEGIKIYNNKVYISSYYIVNQSGRVEIGYYE